MGAKIYGPYDNGVSEVHADPARVMSLLWAKTDGRLDELTRQYNTDSPVAKADAALKLSDAARVAFDLADFNAETGEGATQDLALSLLRHFLTWSNEKK